MRKRKRTNYRLRTYVAAGALLIAMLGLVARSIYLLSDQRIRVNTDLILATRTPSSLGALAEQAKKIDSISSNIDNYSLKEIKGALGDTAVLTATASRELKAQSDAWDEIKSKASNDANAYQEVKRNLDVAARMQDAQFLKVNELLEKSKRTSPTQWFLEIAGSFLVGLVTSWVASATYKRVRQWLRRFVPKLSPQR